MVLVSLVFDYYNMFLNVYMASMPSVSSFRMFFGQVPFNLSAAFKICKIDDDEQDR